MSAGSTHGDVLQRALRAYEFERSRAGDQQEAELARDLQGFYAVAPSTLPDHVDPHLGYIETPDDADLNGPMSPPKWVDVSSYIDQRIRDHAETAPHLHADGSTA